MTVDGTATPMATPTADTPTTDATSSRRLSGHTLANARPDVLRPDYDRAAARVGIVHFGPGAFHRAHQAYYFDRLLERDARRAVCAVSLKTPGVRDALAAQDGLYTLMELDEAPTVRVIGAIREMLVATRDPIAVEPPAVCS